MADLFFNIYPYETVLMILSLCRVQILGLKLEVTNGWKLCFEYHNEQCALTLNFILNRFNICQSLWIKNRSSEGRDYCSRGNTLSWWPFLFWCFLLEWLSACTSSMWLRILYLNWTLIIFMFTVLFFSSRTQGSFFNAASSLPFWRA